jgi:hypothetical protein
VGCDGLCVRVGGAACGGWLCRLSNLPLNITRALALVVTHVTHHQVEPIVDERKKLNVQIQAHLPQVWMGAGSFLLSSVCRAAWPESMHTRLAAVSRNRRHSQDPAAVLPHTPPPPPCLHTQESFHTRNAITYIKTHEAVAKLRENLRAEHNVTIEFCAAVFKGVSWLAGWVHCLVCGH